MTISLNERITFTSIPAHNADNDRKDAEKKVVTGGGAVAATTAAARSKAMKSGVDLFSTSEKAAKGIKGVTEATKTATSVAKQSKGLWTKIVDNARWAKTKVLKWGAKFKNTRFIKPIVNSKLFKAGAGALGYGFGFVTLVSGLSDIGKVTTEMIESKVAD